MSTCFQCWRR